MPKKSRQQLDRRRLLRQAIMRSSREGLSVGSTVLMFAAVKQTGRESGRGSRDGKGTSEGIAERCDLTIDGC